MNIASIFSVNIPSNGLSYSLSFRQSTYNRRYRQSMSNFHNIFKGGSNSNGAQNHPNSRFNNPVLNPLANQQQNAQSNNGLFFGAAQNSGQNNQTGGKLFGNTTGTTDNSIFGGNPLGNTNSNAQKPAIPSNPFFKGGANTANGITQNSGGNNFFGITNAIANTAGNYFNKSNNNGSTPAQGIGQNNQGPGIFNQQPQNTQNQGGIFQNQLNPSNSKPGSFLTPNNQQQNQNTANQIGNNQGNILFYPQNNQNSVFQANQGNNMFQPNQAVQNNQGLQQNQGQVGNLFGQNQNMNMNQPSNVQQNQFGFNNYISHQINPGNSHIMNDPAAYQIFMQQMQNFQTFPNFNGMNTNMSINPMTNNLVNPSLTLMQIKPLLTHLLERLQSSKTQKLRLSRQNLLGSTLLKDSPYRQDFLMLLQEVQQIQMTTEQLAKNNKNLQKYREKQMNIVTQQIQISKKELIKKIEIQRLLNQTKQELNMLQEEIQQTLRPMLNSIKSNKALAVQEPNTFNLNVAKRLTKSMQLLDKNMDDLMAMTTTYEQQQKNKQHKQGELYSDTLNDIKQYYQLTFSEFYALSARFNELKQKLFNKIGNQQQSKHLEDLQRKIKKKQNQLEKSYQWTRELDKMSQDRKREKANEERLKEQQTKLNAMRIKKDYRV